MKIWILLAVLASLPGIRLYKKPSLANALRPDTTTAVKGIFACMILISHASLCFGYDHFTPANTGHYYHFNQYIMPPFMLYMGYALAESIVKKPNYARSIPKHKIFRLWLHYILIAALTFAVTYADGVRLGFLDILKSILPWRLMCLGAAADLSWFVTVMLCFFFLAWISYSVTKKDWQGHLLLTVLSLSFYLFIHAKVKGSAWWNTQPLFPAGLWLSYLFGSKGKIQLEGKWKRIPAALVFLVCVGVTAYFDILIRKDRVSQNGVTIGSFFLMIALLLFTSEIKVGNRFLNFFGVRSYEMYIAQFPVFGLMKTRYFINFCRTIDLYFFAHHGIYSNILYNPYFITCLYIVLSVLIATIYHALYQKIDPLIFSKKKQPKKEDSYAGVQ